MGTHLRAHVQQEEAAAIEQEAALGVQQDAPVMQQEMLGDVPQ